MSEKEGIDMSRQFSAQEAKERTFLGLDLSTQQMKAVVLDDNLKFLQEAFVHYDTEMPEFRTHGGVYMKKDNLTVTAPTAMWVKALDLLLNKLRAGGLDCSKVASISGCAQQHGSVWWRKGASETLRHLNPELFLHTQLNELFVGRESPVWMDSSTTAQCLKLEAAMGGPKMLASLTGSKAYERFTGPQIAKIYETNRHMFNSTEHISLVSSFFCSIFMGDYAPIDYADASGMNLMDIDRRDWNDKCLSACAPYLREKLGPPKEAVTSYGRIAPYFVDRLGFNENCRVVPFTGDNPASLMGMRLMERDVAVSLGTSDTVFMHTPTLSVLDEGHVFISPIDSNWYMTMLCFKNGSLTRERIRDACADGSWSLFNELLNSTPRGNFGNMGLYFTSPEIKPFVQGDFLYNKAGVRVDRFTSQEVQVRALVEGQFIGMRALVELAGLRTGLDANSTATQPGPSDSLRSNEGRIIATGGAAKNASLLQVLADVWNRPVYVQDSVNSAMFGAAYMAKYSLTYDEQGFTECTDMTDTQVMVCEPHKDSDQIYTPMVERYKGIIAQLEKKA